VTDQAPPPPIPPTPADPAPARQTARARALTGLMLLAVMLGGVWAFGYWEPRLLPVRLIEVQGEVHHHSSEQLRDTLVQRLRGGFLTADLWDLKQAAEGIAWVGSAGIHRVWPDRLVVRVNEHKPVARWKGDGLVTADGVIFHPRAGTVPAGLPLLEGDDSRARELVERYIKWRDQLMLAGQLIDSLSVDARGAWRVGLVSKARLELGTKDIEQRLARYISAAPQLDAAGRAELVDLRYSNGFAVKWASNTTAAVDAAGLPAEAALAAEPRPSAKAKGHTKTTTTAVRPAAKAPSKAATRAPARLVAKASPKAATPAPARLVAKAPPKVATPAPARLVAKASPKSATPAPARLAPKAPPKTAAPAPARPQSAPARALTEAGAARPGAKPQERTDKRG
jgi:cell division protein FtsQ